MFEREVSNVPSSIKLPVLKGMRLIVPSKGALISVNDKLIFALASLAFASSILALAASKLACAFSNSVFETMFLSDKVFTFFSSNSAVFASAMADFNIAFAFKSS